LLVNDDPIIPLLKLFQSAKFQEILESHASKQIFSIKESSDIGIFF